jgi:hypothetical protein
MTSPVPEELATGGMITAEEDAVVVPDTGTEEGKGPWTMTAPPPGVGATIWSLRNTDEDKGGGPEGVDGGNCSLTVPPFILPTTGVADPEGECSGGFT